MKNLSLFTVLISTSVFAQTPAVSPMSLNAAIQKAHQELTAAETQKVKGKTDPSAKPCDLNKAYARESNARWLIDHQNELQGISSQVDRILSEAQVKFNKLKAFEVEIVPSDKTVKTNKVSLGEVIAFFNLYATRLKTCPKDQVSEFERQIGNPKYNFLGIDTTSINALLEKVNVELNASLKEPNTQFSMSYVKTGECAYQIQFLIEATVAGKAYSVHVPVQSASAAIKISEDEKWASLSKSGMVIDGVTINGADRYLGFLRNEAGYCNLVPSHVAFSSAVFVTETELNALANQKEIDQLAEKKKMAEVEAEKSRKLQSLFSSIGCSGATDSVDCTGILLNKVFQKDVTTTTRYENCKLVTWRSDSTFYVEILVKGARENYNYSDWTSINRRYYSDQYLQNFLDYITSGKCK